MREKLPVTAPAVTPAEDTGPVASADEQEREITLPADPARVRRPIVFDDTMAGDDLDVPDFLK